MLIPDQYKGRVDESTFHRRHNLEDEKDKTKERISRFMVFQKLFYQAERLTDNRLFENFQDDFEGWTKEDFALADSGIRRMFRDFLNNCGIFTPRSRSHISVYLANLVIANVIPEWPEGELEKQMRESKDFDSYLQPVNSSVPAVKQENLNFKVKDVDKYDQEKPYTENNYRQTFDKSNESYLASNNLGGWA